MCWGSKRLPSDHRNAVSAAEQKAVDDQLPVDWPDLEVLPTSGVIGNQSKYQAQDPRAGFRYASLGTAVVSPFSQGNISINSTRMSDPPLINPNWLAHPADIELSIAAFKRQRQAWEIAQFDDGTRKSPRS